MKQKLLFAIIMGSITTGLVSFMALIINIGMPERIVYIWMKTWLIGCLFSIPTIIILAPRIQNLVNHLGRK